MTHRITRTVTLATVGAGLALGATMSGASASHGAAPSQATETVAVAARSCSLPTLRYGSTGGYVKAFQRIYNKKKSYMAPKIAVDGSFGKASVSAAQGMQYRYNLSIDGVVGPKTWAAITNGTCKV